MKKCIISYLLHWLQWQSIFQNHRRPHWLAHFYLYRSSVPRYQKLLALDHLSGQKSWIITVFTERSRWPLMYIDGYRRVLYRCMSDFDARDGRWSCRLCLDTFLPNIATRRSPSVTDGRRQMSLTDVGCCPSMSVDGRRCLSITAKRRAVLGVAKQSPSLSEISNLALIIRKQTKAGDYRQPSVSDGQRWVSLSDVRRLATSGAY